MNILSEMAQNNTIEERVTLLEIQVTDLREDVTVVQGGVEELDEDVDFLFDETVIQDERLLALEQTSDQVVVELTEINANILGNPKHSHVLIFFFKKLTSVLIFLITMQNFYLDLDTRVVDLEDNGGGDGNSSVAELEVRVETLEGTAADHETRVTTVETDIEGNNNNIESIEN